MPFIGKQPEVGAYQLIDSITTSATATFALAVGGTAYFPASARNLLVSLNGITQAPDSAYTVSGSNIVFDSALTSSDVIDYILVMGDALDIGTPSDGTVGTAQMSYPLGNFSSTGIDDNATSTAITIDSSENVSVSPSGGVITLGASGQITSKQSLDVATAGGRYIGSTNRGIVGQIRIEQTATGADGGYLEFDTCASGSTSPIKRMRLDTDGLKFGNDTAAANALDDYEEGTWTPTYVATSGSFGSLSYGFRVGHYTKIGDLVTANCRLDTSSMSIGSAGGYLLVGSLPFTCHNAAYQSCAIGYCYGYNTVFATSGSTGTGMTALYLYNTGRRNNSESIYPSNLGTGGTNLYMSVTYKTT
jgi:hypothetical protein